MTRRWRWLESTDRLQREAFGFDASAIRGDVRAQAAEVTWRAFAMMREAMELVDEVSWKHWATADAPYVNRDRVIAEAVDVGHFLGGILAALEVTDSEYESAYRAKQEENRRRMREGYSARRKP